MTDLITKTIERLQTKGWQKGTYGPAEGPNCVLGALYYADDRSYSLDFRIATDAVAQELDAYSLGHYQDNIARFNDDPHTSYEDVILLLKKARSRLQE